MNEPRPARPGIVAMVIAGAWTLFGIAMVPYQFILGGDAFLMAEAMAASLMLTLSPSVSLLLCQSGLVGTWRRRLWVLLILSHLSGTALLVIAYSGESSKRSFDSEALFVCAFTLGCCLFAIGATYPFRRRAWRQVADADQTDWSQQVERQQAAIDGSREQESERRA